MQLILNAKDGVGALIQRRGKDTQTEVMKQRLCAPAAARTYSAAFKECMWGFFFWSIWLTNRGNSHAHLPLHIYYHSASLVPTYCIYSAALCIYSCLNDE